ncbi:MAG: hypothetical protein HN653_03145, partial [Candidatus Marinimicrobia bacterium]|nr:hypothetical protein [Candidatus Neomarinimicrobiota bacterium]
MKKTINKIKIKFFRKISNTLITLLSFLTLSCDFQNPAAFELPTWFFDMTFPLVQQKYSLEGMVDNKQIFSTPDSLGMQLMFEGLLPNTSIGTDILEVEIDQSIKYSQPEVASPIFSYTLDLPINIPIQLGGFPFSIPPSSDQTLSKEAWNNIASLTKIDTSILIELKPGIPSNQLPSFVQSVDGFLIKVDDGSNVSDYESTFKNNGLPTSLTGIASILITDISNPPDTLANHSQSTVVKDAIFNSKTSLSQKNIGNAIRIDINLGVASTADANVTIKAGDSLKVNALIQLKISGVDSAIVKVSETTLPVDLPKITFPSDIEIYGGKLKIPSGFETNEINIKS